jgi:hypothetical protein
LWREPEERARTRATVDVFNVQDQGCAAFIPFRAGNFFSRKLAAKGINSALPQLP